MTDNSTHFSVGTGHIIRRYHQAMIMFLVRLKPHELLKFNIMRMSLIKAFYINLYCGITALKPKE